MPILKRLRNWFFQITATPTTPGTRFLKYDQPTEETYRNLFESVPFFLEVGDRAKIDMQGLVHRSTDAEAKSYDETEQTTKTKAVVPYQLPEVKDIIQSIIGNLTTYTGNIVNVRIASNIAEDANFDKRNVFIVEFAPAFIAWLEAELNNALVNIPSIPGGIAGQVLTKQSSLTGDYTWQYPLPSGSAIQYLVRNTSAPTDYSWFDQNYYITYHVTSNTPETFFLYLPFNANLVYLYTSANVTYVTMPLSYTANTVQSFTANLTSGTDGIIVISVTRLNM